MESRLPASDNAELHLNALDWPDPTQIFLVTYDRLDHSMTSLKQGVIGVADDGAGSASKANRLRVGDWILLRISDPSYKNTVEHLLICPPIQVVGKPVLFSNGIAYALSWPTLLWEEEKEQGRLLYHMRIPVDFGGKASWRAKITWETLADLRLRGKDGSYLMSPGQWGIKFACNIIDAPFEVRKFITMVRERLELTNESVP